MATPEQFMAAAHKPMNANTPWGSRYAAELRRVVTEQAAWAPRSQQRHLGPSELGTDCDRQVVWKMAGVPVTNHVVDPWASVVGTAIHAWLADAFVADNVRQGVARWLTETRVVPHPRHSGTADLYDAFEHALVDHKALGPTTSREVKSDQGPPKRYVVQLLLYALGYLKLGLPVKRIVLAIWPRTTSSLNDLYVWDHELTAADFDLLDEVFKQIAARTQVADGVRSGYVSLAQVPANPTPHDCYFCPYYRPEAATMDVPGCAGRPV